MKTRKDSQIVHIDMDAFFAAIEQRDNPYLQNKPVIVGADPKEGRGRGVVSTCSYEARRFGIRSAMPISQAYQKCPHGIFVTPRMSAYCAVSEKLHELFYDFTPDIESVSLDEAFLDISTSFHLFGKEPHDLCSALKRRIRNELKLTASVGLAPTKMIAKIASDLKKPDGFVEVKKENIKAFLEPLDITRLWGIGAKNKERFYEQGIKTFGDLYLFGRENLISIFGDFGVYCWECAQGIDHDEVRSEEQVKSVSNEITFDTDTTDQTTIIDTLIYLSEKVSVRLRNEALYGKTVTLKIRLRGFRTYTRSCTLKNPTNFYDDIYGAVKTLFDAFEFKYEEIRLLGVKVSRFQNTTVQHELFDPVSFKKRSKLHTAIDAIKGRFGFDAIHHGRP